MHEVPVPVEFAMHGLAAAGCVLGLVVGVVWRRREHAGTPLLPRPTAPLPDTAAALCIAIFLYLVLGGLVTSWWDFGPLFGVSDETGALLEGITYNVLFAAGLFAAARHTAGVTLSLGRRVATGMTVGLVTFGVVHAVGTGLLAVYQALGVTPPSQAVADAMRDAEGWCLIVRSVIAVALAPFAEEVFFRGIVLPAIAQLTGVRAAVVLQAVAFGAFHFLGDLSSMPLAIPLAVVGLFTGWLYVRTRSLLAVIVVHAVFNGIQLVFLLAS